MVMGCLPVARIGLWRLHISTLCGSERGLGVATVGGGLSNSLLSTCPCAAEPQQQPQDTPVVPRPLPPATPAAGCIGRCLA